MLAVDRLLRCDLEEAAAAVAEEIPDVVAAFDLIVPLIVHESNLSTLRRYYEMAEIAIRTLVEEPVGGGMGVVADTRSEANPRVVAQLMRRDIPVFLWMAPTPDGNGFVKVVVDRLRGHFGGIPNQCVKTRDGIDEHQFDWASKALARVELERSYSEPLQRAMAICDLSSTDVAEMMGVRRQAVDKWLLSGPPPERLEKIGALVEIADTLKYRLREGSPPLAVRMKSDTYGGRNILEVFADDDHQWLLELIRWSFDFNDVA
ncbi:hypothetical protein [Candidatus Poriferisodalis sp.]|uniref:hypothetical protein n=1 Tax=Candidatus Poriferisodalis sp. TaxID=3101277 RepID=UPI003B5B31AA